MALHRAAGTGADQLVSLLIELGAHVNARNKEGATPLDAAHGSNGKAVSQWSVSSITTADSQTMV